MSLIRDFYLENNGYTLLVSPRANCTLNGRKGQQFLVQKDGRNQWRHCGVVFVSNPVTRSKVEDVIEKELSI